VCVCVCRESERQPDIGEYESFLLEFDDDDDDDDDRSELPSLARQFPSNINV
jgi:hypothetical protein